MADFPRDIIIDILLKLPVKSLGKFRCVSKYWCSLISDPQFIANHLRISSSDDNYTNHQIILTCKGRDLRLKSCSVSSLFNESSTDAVDIVRSFTKPVISVKEVVGSCNGLLCIVAENEYVYLWNPTIRELRRLPYSGLRVEASSSRITYGFGYDSSIDDYKVVAVLSVCRPELSYDTKVMTYTLRPNRWRRIADFPIGPDREPGLFVGGALIWGVWRFDGRGLEVGDESQHAPCISVSWHILAFELATEKQTMLPQPANEKLGLHLSLGKLGECLCLHSSYRENHVYKHVDIWVMKDYGVEESWCKMFTLPYDANPFQMGCHPLYIPLLYSKKNGELLLEFGSGLVLYNPENATLRNVWINKFRLGLDSISYVESLVSPNVDGRAETLHQ